MNTAQSIAEEGNKDIMRDRYYWPYNPEHIDALQKYKQQPSKKYCKKYIQAIKSRL